MPDLSSMSPLDRFKQEVAELKRGKRGRHYRPHKLVMLLAVIELAELGLLPENRIYPKDPLLSIFEAIFVLVKRQDDLCQPGPPFFHLRTSGFWFHRVRPDYRTEYARLTTSGGGLGIIEKYIEYAYLRDDVYQLFMNSASRRDLRLYISDLLNASQGE